MLVPLRVHRVIRESSIIFFFHDAVIGCSKENRENHPKQALNSLHPNFNMHILCTGLFTLFSKCACKENLFSNQEVLQLIIISFILMTLMFDSWVRLKGEIRCWSLLGIKGLTKKSKRPRLKFNLAFWVSTNQPSNNWAEKKERNKNNKFINKWYQGYLKVVHSWKWYNNLQNTTKQKEKAN